MRNAPCNESAIEPEDKRRREVRGALAVRRKPPPPSPPRLLATLPGADPGEDAPSPGTEELSALVRP